MTPYRFDNSKKKQVRTWQSILTIGIFVVCGVVIIIGLGTLIVQKIIQGPAWAMRSVTDQVQTTINALTPKSLLIQKIQTLESQADRDAVAIMELQALRFDYEQLKKSVGYYDEPPATITARVTGKPNASLFNTIILDRGERHGIAVGDLVITQQAIALGKIVSVTSSTATVTLFSGPQFNDQLLIQNQEGVTVPAQGKGSGNFEIHIPREIIVREGDILSLPENPLLAVGIVKSIKFDPRDPFQTILARVPVNINQVGFVEVVK
jgi:cell shape-determining protein MreC